MSNSNELNLRDQTCYCGKARNLDICEFQCGMCLRYYHETCITDYPGNFIPFMVNYQFFCENCSAQQTLNKKPINFGQMCLTAICNLIRKFPGKKMFSKNSEIIPFIEKYWEILTSVPVRTKNTWHLTISKDMSNYPNIFTSEDHESDQKYGLVNFDLSCISPNNGKLQNLMFCKSIVCNTKTSKEVKSKHTKRKPLETSKVVLKKKCKLSEPIEEAKIHLPFNVEGYRYSLPERDPNKPDPRFNDKSNISPDLYRFYKEEAVLLSLNDRAADLILNENRLTVTGYKGYSMIRTNYGVKQGCWYFEVTIDSLPDLSAVRIGWSQTLAALSAPCGSDVFGYSWRSKKGTSFHNSYGQHYSDGGYKEGDVVGFCIQYPNRSYFKDMLEDCKTRTNIITHKGSIYFEEAYNKREAEKNMEICKGGQMIMFLNGVNQGIAFEDFKDGVYYPSISLYKNAQVTVNLGPTFKFPPKNLQYKPISLVINEIED